MKKSIIRTLFVFGLVLVLGFGAVASIVSGAMVIKKRKSRF